MRRRLRTIGRSTATACSPPLSGGSGHDEVIGEYLGEGAIAPLLMIRRGRTSSSHASDPDQLYDLASDPPGADQSRGETGAEHEPRRVEAYPHKGG